MMLKVDRFVVLCVLAFIAAGCGGLRLDDRELRRSEFPFEYRVAAPPDVVWNCMLQAMEKEGWSVVQKLPDHGFASFAQPAKPFAESKWPGSPYFDRKHAIVIGPRERKGEPMAYANLWVSGHARGSMLRVRGIKCTPTSIWSPPTARAFEGTDVQAYEYRWERLIDEVRRAALAGKGAPK